MKFKDEDITEPTGEFANAIRDFRSAVKHVAERETARPLSLDWLTPARKRHRTHQHRMVLGWACAAALCFATLPFAVPFAFHSSPTPIHVGQQTPTAAPRAKSSEPERGLMEQVDADVSESVPSSLAPLVELGNTDTVSENYSGDTLFDGAALAQTGSTDAAH